MSPSAHAHFITSFLQLQTSNILIESPKKKILYASPFLQGDNLFIKESNTDYFWIFLVWKLVIVNTYTFKPVFTRHLPSALSIIPSKACQTSLRNSFVFFVFKSTSLLLDSCPALKSVHTFRLQKSFCLHHKLVKAKSRYFEQECKTHI